MQVLLLVLAAAVLSSATPVWLRSGGASISEQIDTRSPFGSSDSIWRIPGINGVDVISEGNGLSRLVSPQLVTRVGVVPTNTATGSLLSVGNEELSGLISPRILEAVDSQSIPTKQISPAARLLLLASSSALRQGGSPIASALKQAGLVVVPGVGLAPVSSDSGISGLGELLPIRSSLGSGSLSRFGVGGVSDLITTQLLGRSSSVPALVQGGQISIQSLNKLSIAEILAASQLSTQNQLPIELAVAIVKQSDLINQEILRDLDVSGGEIGELSAGKTSALSLLQLSNRPSLSAIESAMIQSEKRAFLDAAIKKQLSQIVDANSDVNAESVILNALSNGIREDIVGQNGLGLIGVGRGSVNSAEILKRLQAASIAKQTLKMFNQLV